jgi:hypothetical protein
MTTAHVKATDLILELDALATTCTSGEALEHVEADPVVAGKFSTEERDDNDVRSSLPRLLSRN